MTDLTRMKVIKSSCQTFLDHLLLRLSLMQLMLLKYTLGQSLTYFLRLTLIECPKCIEGTYLC